MAESGKGNLLIDELLQGKQRQTENQEEGR